MECKTVKVLTVTEKEVRVPINEGWIVHYNPDTLKTDYIKIDVSHDYIKVSHTEARDNPIFIAEKIAEGWEKTIDPTSYTVVLSKKRHFAITNPKVLEKAGYKDISTSETNRGIMTKIHDLFEKQVELETKLVAQGKELKRMENLNFLQRAWFLITKKTKYRDEESQC